MKNYSKEPFVATLDYSDYPEYFERARVIRVSNKTIKDELKSVPLVLRAARSTHALLLQSSSGRVHPDLLAAILIGFWRKSSRPAIVMMGCMWQRDDGLAGIIQKILLHLADRAIFRFAPQSTDELPLFSATWGISQDKLRFLNYFYTFTDKDLSSPAPAQEDFIFSGGNSHRDYKALLKASEMLPEYKFVIASNLLDGIKLPPNVRAGQVQRTEFIRLMRASNAVVVPIQAGLIRATGQQTYLNAMLLEKPVIVTEALGVHDHVRDGETAIVVDGSPESYANAIHKVFDPKNKLEIEHICRAGRESVLRDYSFEKHCARLLDILDESINDYYNPK
jgi:glycosyltransferase involved in cell wall biosynthesis